MNFTLKISSEHKPFVHVGTARATYDRYGDVRRIYLEVRHRELSLFKEISAIDTRQLQLKFDELMASWHRRYTAHVQKEEARAARQLAIETLEAGNEAAQSLVNEAEFKRNEIDSILAHTLSVDDAVNWSKLEFSQKFDAAPFEEPQPKVPKYPDVTEFIEQTYTPPHISVLAKIFFQAKRINAQHRARFDRQEAERKKQVQKNRAKKSKLEAGYDSKLKSWKADKKKWDAKQREKKAKFEAERELHNLKVRDLKTQWSEGAPDAVIQHADIVLGSSGYPDWMEPSYLIQYDQSQKIFKIEYSLPSPEVVNLVKSARFVRSTGEITEKMISQTEQKRLYDSLCYQIALRSVHEIFEADTADNIDAVAFNGVVDFVDGATGKQSRATILSAIFEKEVFEELNLEAVDPKACFKSFKGVAASSLIGLAPVNPVMAMDREDSRFVESQDAALDSIESENLASMDWEEFEHLVRAIFEQEFAVDGGEVKVTQASSDGGVDAVAFDPDPIRGGKIVIQAKRYTNTVGVAAVRELFGTVVNEGATKGILVTTADYGADAYKFASDKPLTLLNGGNLLYLLEKHGFKGRIDIKAARKEMGLN